jgi:hypothetical protein
MQRALTAESFLRHYQADPRRACAQARGLGTRAAALAVALAAHFASPPHADYTYWLWRFACPPLPERLRRSGWAWTPQQTLHHAAWRITLHRDGEAAIAQAERLTAALSQTNLMQETFV